MTYKEIEVGSVVTDGTTIHGVFVIKKTDSDGNEFFIPKDEGNSDYQEYLVWKAEQ